MKKKIDLLRGAARRRRPLLIAAAVALIVGIAALLAARHFLRDDGLLVPVPVAVQSAFRPRPAVMPPSRIDIARLDSRLARLGENEDMVGMAVAVVENGQTLFAKGYGVTAPESTEPVTDKTVFRWASLSKGVAATLVARLVEEGRLSFSDPVSRWAPSLRLPNRGETKATVADLLSHRLGIVRNAYDGKLEDGEDPRNIRKMLAELQADCPPGTCHAYQNVAFDAASDIVRKVTGHSYQAMVERALFKPLGMTSASMTREALAHSASWARPTQGGRVHEVEDAYYRVPAAGAVNSSIADLALWMRAQMGEAPTVLTPKLLETIHAPRVSTQARRSRRSVYDRAMTEATYAMGWRDYQYLGHRLIGHRGAVDGYRSLILFDPARRTGVAVLWNSTAIRPVGIPLEIFDMVYGAERHDWLELDVPDTRSEGLSERRSSR